MLRDMTSLGLCQPPQLSWNGISRCRESTRSFGHRYFHKSCPEPTGASPMLLKLSKGEQRRSELRF